MIEKKKRHNLPPFSKNHRVGKEGGTPPKYSKEELGA